MDLNDLRSLITLLSFATFIGIVAWAYSGKRKQSFEEAALLPFTDDEPLDAAWQSSRNNERKAP
jgi:cytochrome c oxidase cbb3-type subunit IV